MPEFGWSISGSDEDNDSSTEIAIEEHQTECEVYDSQEDQYYTEIPDDFADEM